MVKNAVTTTYTYNNNNQLETETAGGVTITYSYDKNGNLISKTGGGSTTTYTWNWKNLLVSVTESAGTTVYEYDGDGTRISKTQAGVKTKYINDVALGLVEVLMETDNSGAVQAIYNYGNDLISMNRGGVNSFYFYDGLGSTRQLTDSGEAVVASYTYDSFGNLIASSGTTANTYGFTGEQQFGEADNLVFLRARYYKIDIGRFISRDPIGYMGGLNLYSYVGNNPVNRRDPYGLSGLLGNLPSTYPPPTGKCAGTIAKVYKLFLSNWFNGDNGVSNDKFAHCYISCRLTQDCSTSASGIMGYMKETLDMILPLDYFDWGDIAANEIGNSIGSNGGDSSSCKGKKDKKKTCEEGCSKYYGSGGDMYLP